MRRPGRPRKNEEDQRREQLLEQAVRLFGEHGFGGLSLETIAREAQVSLRTIYSQFGGKAGLFSAAVRRYSDFFVAALPVSPNAEASLESVLSEFAREYLYRLTRPEVLRMRAQFLAEASRFPELARELYSQGPERTLNHLARFFAVQQQAGTIAAADPLFLAGQFVSGLRGERFQRLEFGLDPAPTPEVVALWASEAVGIFLQGSRRGSEVAP
jgi:TetR/AcrR family transcriptional regulator, mexJK operon transcriptional repressor